MQTTLCPRCKDYNITIRCSKKHLETCHSLKIDDIREISQKVADMTEEHKSRKRKHGENIPLKRKAIIDYAESLIQPNTENLKNFLLK